MTVEALKNAIERLTDHERRSLAVWLNDLDYDSWDRQMVKDFSPGGQGTALLEMVQLEIAQGEVVLFEKGQAPN